MIARRWAAGSRSWRPRSWEPKGPEGQGTEWTGKDGTGEAGPLPCSGRGPEKTRGGAPSLPRRDLVKPSGWPIRHPPRRRTSVHVADDEAPEVRPDHPGHQLGSIDPQMGGVDGQPDVVLALQAECPLLLDGVLAGLLPGL